MKNLVALFILFTSVGAAAQELPQGLKEVLACVVPNQNSQPQVVLSVSVSNENNGDFVLVAMNDKGQSVRFFNQLEKGEFAAGLDRGFTLFPVLEESFRQDAGVIRNAGYILLGKSDQGFGGILSAKGNLYPLNCTRK